MQYRVWYLGSRSDLVLLGALRREMFVILVIHMSTTKKVLLIALNLIPIVIMVVSIPLFTNDLLLTALYVLIIVTALMSWRKRGDVTALLFGFVVMTVSEYFFIMTGVETFNRTSFLGVMPLWLPFLWGYGFVVMKRAVKILDV